MPALEIGTKVRIASREVLNECANGTPNVVGPMYNYAGQLATIVTSTESYIDPSINLYEIDLDAGRWYWAEQLFEEGSFEHPKPEAPVNLNDLF